VNQQSTRIKNTTAAPVGGNALNIIAVFEQLLVKSIRLSDLHVSARWQISGRQFTEIRKMLNDHHKEQLILIDLLVDRMRILGGASRVFASDFLRGTRFCRVIRGPRELSKMLLDLLVAHEAVLNAAHPYNSNDYPHWVRDFAVGQVVLANEHQWEIINDRVLWAGPQQRLLATDTRRQHKCE